MSKRKILKRINNGQDSSSDSDSDCELSAYEKMRLKNIGERDILLRNLGIAKAVEDFNAVVPKSIQSPTPRKTPTPRVKNHVADLPRREPSRRIRNMKADTNIYIKEEPITDEEEEDKRLLDSLPMAMEDEQSKDFITMLKDIKQEVVYDPLINLKESSLEKFQEAMMCLKMYSEPRKVVPKRIQSILVHPIVTKKLILTGSCSGHLGLWDLEADSVFEFRPHQCATNCLSVNPFDQTKIFSTSLDGTFVCADLETCLFSSVYATDFGDKIRHLTWHDQLNHKTFLICHGNGKIGLLDLRYSKKITTWIPCFERSARTVQHHPIMDQYFLVSSGAGSSCNIYDIRQCSARKAIPVIEMDHKKGLTSAFFSPAGDQVLSTSNDDCVRIYSISHFYKASLKKTIPHNNHTGRWLSVFKAMWHPSRNDVFFIGSLLNPRRIQIYNNNGKLISELRNEAMTTISPVLSAHAVLPIIAGGNSSGKVHVFVAPEIKTEIMD
nr:WD repeat-containing protein 76-like [Halyomorpha halys]